MSMHPRTLTHVFILQKDRILYGTLAKWMHSLITDVIITQFEESIVFFAIICAVSDTNMRNTLILFMSLQVKPDNFHKKWSLSCTRKGNLFFFLNWKIRTRTETQYVITNHGKQFQASKRCSLRYYRCFRQTCRMPSLLSKLGTFCDN